MAKVPGRPNRSHFPKDDFHLDLAAGSCTCPAGQVTRTIVPAGKRTDHTGRTYRLQAFQFDGAVCRVCPLRSQCIVAKGRQGRRVLIHPQEALLQQARALQQSTDYDQYRARRVVAEHRLARLVQLGIRQSRYFGRAKTKFQLYLAATVANLTLVAAKVRLTGDSGGDRQSHFCCCRQCGGQFGRCPARTTMVPDCAHVGLAAQNLLLNTGFPARFLAVNERRTDCYRGGIWQCLIHALKKCGRTYKERNPTSHISCQKSTSREYAVLRTLECRSIIL